MEGSSPLGQVGWSSQLGRLFGVRWAQAFLLQHKQDHLFERPEAGPDWSHLENLSACSAQCGQEGEGVRVRPRGALSGALSAEGLGSERGIHA